MNELNFKVIVTCLLPVFKLLLLDWFLHHKLGQA